MKNLTFLFTLFLSLQSFGQNNEINKLDLLGCWIDSREENTNTNISVYRPCNFKKFPESRFRFKMDLKKDSTCCWYYLAPNDRHFMKDGTWAFNKEKKVLKIFNLNNEEVKSFKIEQVDDNILKIEN
jgi:hypothetical protein